MFAILLFRITITDERNGKTNAEDCTYTESDEYVQKQNSYTGGIFMGDIRFSDYVPFDPSIQVFSASEGSAIVPPEFRGLQAFEYSGWWNEMLASHEGCYIHAGLQPAATYYSKGKGSLKMFSDVCVNSFENFRIGTGKHAIMCNEDGYIIKDGMLLRLSEDEFISFWMLPYIDYVYQNGNYEDCVSEDITGKVFFYQLAGPTSLDLVEKVTGEEFHSLKFSNFRMAEIDGRRVMILRMGMAGSLAYEVHGRIEDALYVYNKLIEAGKDYKITKIGKHTYRNVHTEGGFPQQSLHFTSVITDPGYIKYMTEKGLTGAKLEFSGSVGDNIIDHCVRPGDVGWSRIVKFDHDFVGKAALEKTMEKPEKAPATLVWDKDDILDVWASMFDRDNEPYALMDVVEDFSYSKGHLELHADKVFAGEKEIGVSSGRMFSASGREMISLGFIDPEYAVPGTELGILWGNPGKRQKMIKAIVGQYPYLDEGGHAK